MIVDRSSFSEDLSGELLMAWEKAPGRAVFLGGRADLEDDEIAWRVQAKISWVLSL